MTLTEAQLSELADPHRLQVLASIDVDNHELRDKLDVLAAHSATQFGLPMSLTTIVLDSAQLLAGSHGAAGWIAQSGGTPTEWAFCARTVHTGRPYVVHDAAHDPVQATNPLVTEDGFGSYAGVPLIVDGQVLGAHCVLGTTAYMFTGEDMARLRAVGDQVVALLEAYRLPVA